MNQRVFVSFLVKFLTKCHSFSVSIETSEPFFCLQNFSLSALQSIFSSWKEYLEQTVTNVYGKPTDKREKKKQGKMIYLLTFQLQKLKEATQKENWMKSSDTQESFYIWHGTVGIG